ncbi:MAG: hypothetical protein AAGG01_07525 [Planctomycetota bacterium]
MSEESACGAVDTSFVIAERTLLISAGTLALLLVFLAAAGERRPRSVYVFVGSELPFDRRSGDERLLGLVSQVGSSGKERLPAVLATSQRADGDPRRPAGADRVVGEVAAGRFGHSAAGFEPMLQHPVRTTVKLTSRAGRTLSGARRVHLQIREDPALELYELSPCAELGHWDAALPRAMQGTVHVTDSLGRCWRSETSLAPGKTSTVSPGPEWIAMSQVRSSGDATTTRIRPGRLQWELRVGDRPGTRGSGWLATDGGFHAVIPRRTALAAGGDLRLGWSVPGGKRELLCAWFSDSQLSHIDLPPSPIGEVVPFSDPDIE